MIDMLWADERKALMGIESSLRGWAIRSGLQEWPFVVAIYNRLNLLRFRRKWDEPVAFQGAHFSIGKDLSLYPAVRNGAFEANELKALTRRVTPTDTVWDVGANIGIYAVLLGRAAAKGHVVSFEPVTSTRERLIGNLQRNDVTNVTVEPWALSDSKGVATMAIFPNAPGCDTIISTGIAVDPHDEMQVRTMTAGEYVKASPYGPPDVIKVDIEGHEPEFLRGAWKILEKERPTLMIEYVPERADGQRGPIWSKVLTDLFGIYGSADLYGVSGHERVTSVAPESLEPGLYTLIFHRPAAGSVASAPS